MRWTRIISAITAGARQTGERQRIFGPLRIERLEKQLRANAREQRKEGKLAGTRIRETSRYPN